VQKGHPKILIRKKCTIPEEVVIDAKDPGTAYPAPVQYSITANIALVASFLFVAQFTATDVFTTLKTEDKSSPQMHWLVEHCSSMARSKPKEAQERRNLTAGEFWRVRVDESDIGC
jgi:hypothetical protein